MLGGSCARNGGANRHMPASIARATVNLANRSVSETMGRAACEISGLAVPGGIVSGREIIVASEVPEISKRTAVGSAGSLQLNISEFALAIHRRVQTHRL